MNWRKNHLDKLLFFQLISAANESLMWDFNLMDFWMCNNKNMNSLCVCNFGPERTIINNFTSCFCWHLKWKGLCLGWMKSRFDHIGCSHHSKIPVGLLNLIFFSALLTKFPLWSHALNICNKNSARHLFSMEISWVSCGMHSESKSLKKVQFRKVCLKD